LTSILEVLVAIAIVAVFVAFTCVAISPWIFLAMILASA